MAEKEAPTTSSDTGKKKKIEIMVGVGAVAILAYFYFKNKSSSSTTTAAIPVTPYVGGTGSAGSGFNSTVGQLNPIPVMGATYNTNSGNTWNSTTNNAWNTNNTTTTNNTSTSNVSSSITNPAPKGKSSVYVPTGKKGVTTSGGTVKKSGTTATAKPYQGLTGVNTLNSTPAGYGTTLIPRKTFGL